jgi:hypothetical protein
MNNMDRNKTQPEDELDRLLDAALAKYVDVDPRAGLENRIMANLRSGQSTTRPWWRWGAAAALAAILIVLALSLRSNRSHPKTANHLQVTPSQRTPSPEVRRASGFGSGAVRPHKSRPVLTAHALSRKTVVSEDPKLDQFPSPQPLNDQERMLALYVAQFYDEAVIVAELRAEALIKERQDEMQGAERGGNSSSQSR